MGGDLAPGESLFSLSHHRLPLALQFGIELCEISPFTLICQLMLLLCKSCLDSHVVEISWLQISCLEDTILQQVLGSSGSYNLSRFFSCGFPESEV